MCQNFMKSTKSQKKTLVLHYSIYIYIYIDMGSPNKTKIRVIDQIINKMNLMGSSTDPVLDVFFNDH